MFALNEPEIDLKLVMHYHQPQELLRIHSRETHFTEGITVLRCRG